MTDVNRQLAPMTDANRPLGPLIVVIVGVMVALAVFWVGFMLAPAVVLLIGYLALSAGDKARRQRTANGGHSERNRVQLAAEIPPAGETAREPRVVREPRASGEPRVAGEPRSAGEPRAATETKTAKELV